MKIYDNETISKKIKKREKISKIRKLIFNPIIIIIFIICATVFIKKIISPNTTPSFLEYKAFIVGSGSMEPVLNVGDMVIVGKAEKENIKKGDIITFHQNEGKNTITHRIIDIIEENGEIKYKTKGDNNNASDSYLVSYDNIEGIYKFKISKIGTIINYMQNAFVLTFIITIFFIIFIIGERKEDKNTIRHEKRAEYEKQNKEQNKN